MSGEGEGADGQRVEELLRVNAELAAEVRALTLGRTESPRVSQLPAARQLGKLQAERAALAADLGDAEGRLRAVEAERDGLLRHRDELQREVERLRHGWRGLLRRTRARLFGS